MMNEMAGLSQDVCEVLLGADAQIGPARLVARLSGGKARETDLVRQEVVERKKPFTSEVSVTSFQKSGRTGRRRRTHTRSTTSVSATSISSAEAATRRTSDAVVVGWL